MTVGTQDPQQRSDEELTELWHQVGEQIIRGQSRHDARVDRLETKVDRLETKVDRLETKVDRLDRNVAGLTTDVAGLKTDVAARFDRLETDLTATREQLNSLERASEGRANRVDAKLEQLIALIGRAETKRP